MKIFAGCVVINAAFCIPVDHTGLFHNLNSLLPTRRADRRSRRRSRQRKSQQQRNDYSHGCLLPSFRMMTHPNKFIDIDKQFIRSQTLASAALAESMPIIIVSYIFRRSQAGRERGRKLKPGMGRTFMPEGAAPPLPVGRSIPSGELARKQTATLTGDARWYKATP